MPKGAIFLILLLTLVSCAIGPDYKRPAIDSSSSWRIEEKEIKETANTAWWEQFDDPVLNELILSAIKANKDLMIATARVEEFLGTQEAAHMVGSKRRFGALGHCV